MLFARQHPRGNLSPSKLGPTTTTLGFLGGRHNNSSQHPHRPGALLAQTVRLVAWLGCIVLPVVALFSVRRDTQQLVTFPTMVQQHPHHHHHHYRSNNNRRQQNLATAAAPAQKKETDTDLLYSQLLLSVVSKPSSTTTKATTSKKTASLEAPNSEDEGGLEEEEDGDDDGKDEEGLDIDESVENVPFSPLLQELYQYQPPRKGPRTHYPQECIGGGRGSGSGSSGSQRRQRQLQIGSTTTSSSGDDASLFAPYFAQDKKRRSRLNEDRILYELLFRRHYESSPTTTTAVSPPSFNATVDITRQQRFTYIEMGGFNGLEESNSRFFDVCLNWDGLLVEPNPRPFQQLVENRPRAHVASLAASCSTHDGLHNRTIAFYDYPYPTAGQKDGTHSETKFAGRQDLVQVPCGSLTPLIRDVFGGTIHLFSLDVETAEPLVLQHLDLSHLTVEVLLIEVQNQYCPPSPGECYARDQTRSIMDRHFYVRYEGIVENSDVYIHPQASHHLASLRKAGKVPSTTTATSSGKAAAAAAAASS